MGIQVGDNFDHKSKKPLDNRTSYATLAAMKAVVDANINEGCFAYCAETNKYYTFLSTNTVDADTGKWREFSASDSSMELTQAQYDALSQAEKMNGTTYFITDGEGGGSSSIQTATLNAGDTTVTFSVPTSGNYLADIYTSDGRNYIAIDTSVSGSITITFSASASNATVFLELKGV